MNRNEEYQKLLQELETPNPAAEHTLTRARARNRRRKWIFTPALSLTAVFACFVLMINVSLPIAQACSSVPILKELVETLQFNDSLNAAIENGYLQDLSMTKTQNGVTVTLDSVVADQKQINVFYYVKTNADAPLPLEQLALVDYGFYLENGEKISGIPFHSTTFSESDGVVTSNPREMEVITQDFLTNEIPDTLILKLNFGNVEQFRDQEVNASSLDPADYETTASFTFTLKLDPTLLKAGQMIDVEQDFELGDQNFTLNSVEFYPTFLQMNLESDPSNTCLLNPTSLDYYAEDRNGNIYGEKINAVTGYGSSDSREFYCRLESPWFSGSSQLIIHITGAALREKDTDPIEINLKTGKTSSLPDDITSITVTHEKSGTVLDITTPYTEEDSSPENFACYDSAGNPYNVNTGFSKALNSDEENHYYFYLGDYDQEIILLGQENEILWEGDICISLNLD